MASISLICPKLPMRNKAISKAFYEEKLGFKEIGNTSFSEYLMLERDGLELHFFAFPDLNTLENDGQVYLRTNQIDQLYSELIERSAPIHPNGGLEIKPWGQKEFAILDPDNNLLTFGQTL